MSAVVTDRLPLVAAALLIVSTASLAAPDAAVEEAPGDRWLVGFEDLERAAIEDGEWQGHAVLDVNEAIAFALVEVHDPVGFHLEDRHRDNVAYVEREDPLAYEPLFQPDDPRYGEQYAFDQIHAPAAWNLTRGEEHVNVSVVDTGIDQDHEDLQATVAAQRDFVADDDEADDRCGHGTHVAGTVSANTDNGIGVAGTADGVNLLVAKALSNTLLLQCTGSSSDVANAITWSTDRGADVISMSIGSTSSSEAIGEAVDYAWESGVLIVAAAGNDGDCEDCVRYPAARERVVAVTCTTPERAQCSFSSQGPEAELAAPGEDVLSTYNDGGYEELSGTSMSTPHVSGAAALALSLDPTLTNSQLRELLNTTARDLGEAGHDRVFGHGELDVASLLEAVDVDTNRAPTASFEATCSELNCTFDAADASDPDGEILAYDWQLGDNTTANGSLVEHAYEEAGSYEVELLVEDDEGVEDRAREEVHVSAPTEGLFAEAFDDGAAEDVELSGLWHVDDGCAQAPSAPSYLGYHREDACTYDTGEHTTGEARFSVDLGPAEAPELSFQHRWQTESTSCGLISCNGYDHMRVELRADEDDAWSTLAEWTSLDDDQPDWTQASFDLSEHATGTVEIRLVFDSRDDRSNDHEGWFVDDVVVEEP